MVFEGVGMNYQKTKDKYLKEKVDTFVVRVTKVRKNDTNFCQGKRKIT